MTRPMYGKDDGQVMVYVALVILLLVGFIAFAADYTNLWHQRQLARTAADATCQAAAVDLYMVALGQQTANMGFTPAAGATVSCASTPGAAPCIIGGYNGFSNTSGTNPQDAVQMTFPTSVTGHSPPSGVAVPFVQVDATRNVSSFIPVHGSVTPVHVTSVCGLTALPTTPPIIVLHPTLTNSFNVQGSPSVTITGGPSTSIEVNSGDPAAVNIGGSAKVDLSLAGPSCPGSCGGDFATYGGPQTAPGTVLWGNRPGQWLYPTPPVADPYANITTPSSTGLSNGTSTNVPHGTNGCPDPDGCTEYTAGLYPSGINIKKQGGNGGTAIFDPGLYYITGGLQLAANSTVRVSTATGDGSGGVLFYFSGTGINCSGGSKNSNLCVNANSGKGVNGNGHNIDPYYIAGGSHDVGNGPVVSVSLQCPGGGSNPPQVPASITGNVLLGPCPGSNGISVNYADPTGQYRGFVFWQDRSAAASADWQGGGSSIVSGFQYFHQCHLANGTGTQPCDSTGYGATFNLAGNSPAGSFTIGSIVTDVLNLGGSTSIYMFLNPKPSFTGLQVALLQ